MRVLGRPPLRQDVQEALGPDPRFLPAREPAATLNDKTSRLVLRSSNTVHKSAPPMPRRSWRTTPHPGSGSMVELLGSYPRGQLDLLRIGKALSCEGFSSK